MENKNHIEELFRETFKNFEEPVRPELWTKLQARIETPVSDPGTSLTASKAVTGGAQWISGSILQWVVGAAIIISSATGAYLYFSQDADKITQTEVSNIPDANDKSIVESTPVGDPQQPSNSNNSGTVTPSENRSSTSAENKADDRLVNNNKELTSGERSDQSELADSPSAGIQSTVQTTPSVASPSVSTPANTNVAVSTSQPAIDARIKIIASTTTGTAPLEVAFELNGYAADIEWEFGDGETSRAVKSTHIFTESGSYSVTAYITGPDGNKLTEKINIKVLADLTIKNIPNVFTPNQDGLNDIFRFDAPQFTEMEIVIFDKTGKSIYKSMDMVKGWDGRLNSGLEAPAETYLYTIFATSSDNRKHQQKGFIRIIR